MFGRNGGGTGFDLGSRRSGSGAGCGSSDMVKDSCRQCTGDDQCRCGGQASDRGPYRSAFAPHQRGGLLHHLNLGVEKLKARHIGQFYEIFAKWPDQEDGVMPRKIGLDRKQRCQYCDRESNAEQHRIGVGRLSGSSEGNNDTCKAENNASFGIQGLGMDIQRLALRRHLIKQHLQRRQLRLIRHWRAWYGSAVTFSPGAQEETG